MSLQGKVALVTGASRGIGRAIAETLARDGATVIGTATSAAGAQAITDYLQAAGLGGIGLALDVNDSAAVEAALAEIEKQHGPIALLVNNAGITRDQLLMRMKEDDWDAVLDTNLRSVYRLSKAVLRGMMKARWGRIISIASVVGSAGSAGQTNYAAAKAGMMGFTKSLAREVGSRNITVNCVAPGFIDTDMTAGLADDYKQKLLTQIPLERLGQPQEIADAVGFLASDKAAYVTGTTLHVNGGMFMN
ncbi:3-oxoacyl-ACP reductase FabG [Chitinimonas arctica]|uniref:3-oxoacyl-[acyl-carrier-protein] reductase n=1 Tax=Chitinimonas arctica TaxID=2594795 RepID=A0A516SIB8_9NEIS|nr:3-oxoacyl-ACP reductase FabG [Chitinimonas arctica]QDQ27886.1 3-oxoacyl-ACP reductase FabG [Chitinimonas arctica]